MAQRDEPIGVSLLPVVGSIRRLVRHSQLLVAAAAKERGLLVSDMNALARITDWGGVPTGVLAHSLPLDQSSVTDLADRLERAGLAERTKYPADRRVVVLKATPAGEQLVSEAFGPVFMALAKILDGMPPRDREVVGRFLHDADHAMREFVGEMAVDPPRKHASGT